MKKNFFALLLFPLISQAQLSPSICKQFPAHIVLKIDEINNKTQLSDQSIYKIAKKMMLQDSLAKDNQTKGTTIKTLKSIYAIDNSFLKKVLTTNELEKYNYDADKDNRFLCALIENEKLKLNNEQIKKIRFLNDSLENTPKKSLKENLQFQNKKLDKILTQKQYVELIQYCYNDIAIEDAKNDWQKVLNFKLNNPAKEKEEYKMIVNYHLKKNTFLDKKAEQFNKTKRDFLALKATVMEPTLLTHVKIRNGDKVANNKYANVIEFEKELELSKSQIDSLLLKYQRFEKIKIRNKENEINESIEQPQVLPIEFDEIVMILKPEQFEKWLIIKNKKESEKKARLDWTSLEAENLTTGLEKTKTSEFLTIYHLKLLIAQEKLKSWKNRENLFAIRDLELKKPDVLRQLESINKNKKNTPKTELVW